MAVQQDKPKIAAVAIEAPRWSTLVLVCRDCRKRKNGPRETKPKKLAKALRYFTHGHEARPRAVLSSCLKLCPDDATAVAWVGNAEPPRVAAVGSVEQLEGIVRKLAAPR